MFKKILIANRGEIACRIIKSARKLGIKTIAVYSEADRDGLHVEMADEAVLIGAAPAAQSYLLIDRIVEACRATGAEALVHPGDGSPVDGEFDVVLDGIGGPMLAPLLAATARNGRVVVYGNSADAESTFRVETFYSKGVTIYGFRVFTSVPPAQGVKDMATLADQAASGALSVKVQATAPLADALPLIADLYARKVTGKVVITR